MDLKKIKVDVVDKSNKPLSPTNLLVARTLVNRERAIWIGKNKIRLIKTKQDWIKLKNQVIDEEYRMCYICGEFIPATEHATVDHINPRSKFGKDERENLHCCCKRCNDDKSNMTLDEYYEHVKREKMKHNKYDYLILDKLKKVVEKEYNSDDNKNYA
jgi:5-methylcytosine-specific restriction endonuclease McrA